MSNKNLTVQINRFDIEFESIFDLNGNNLMFCEDAARRIRGFLESLDFVADYWFKVEHQESLHAHNAVVIDQKDTLKTCY